MATASDLFGRGDADFIVVAPGPETTTSPALTANLILRVVLGILANLVCVVPLKHLYRGGEFAAAVFIGNIMAANFKNVVHSLIWRDDNTDSWWPGYGLCDFYPYFHNVTVSLYVTCLLAIMRNLAQQVGMMRANPLTVRERRRRNLGQALIMFSLPVIQLAWVWPLTSQRYIVASLVGCTWSAWPSWPYIVFFVAAPVFVSLFTTFYAVLIYIRFREVAKTTVSALSNNRVANQRAQRAKRRLYLMVISILVPFLPVIIILAVLNVNHASPLMPFDYDTIHKTQFPFPWNTIVYLPSNQLEFAFINNCYISILSAAPVFVFFGMTKNAMNTYRRGCLRVGLGRVFPALHQEYDPDRDAYGSSGMSSNATGSTNTTTTAKIKHFLSSRQRTTMSTSSGESSHHDHMQSLNDALSSVDIEQGRPPNHPLQPQPAYSATVPDNSNPAELFRHNPFLFRTHINFSSPFKLFPSFMSKKTAHPHTDQVLPLGSLTSVIHQPHWEPPTHPSNIQTRVWSNGEGGLSGRTTPEVGLLDPSPSGHAVTIETHLTRETHKR
ncbi:pheromone A receptor-domain-containing protein [Ilyonectria sp. MPI-CAGE-AT-0026]|nr:pheromone A receptor-domain-containing protein [Ilyonectria sp. MPI-CAGE-AT-0026]